MKHNYLVFIVHSVCRKRWCFLRDLKSQLHFGRCFSGVVDSMLVFILVLTWVLGCVCKSGEASRNLSQMNCAWKTATLKMEASSMWQPVISEARLIDFIFPWGNYIWQLYFMCWSLISRSSVGISCQHVTKTTLYYIPQNLALCRGLNMFWLSRGRSLKTSVWPLHYF